MLKNGFFGLGAAVARLLLSLASVPLLVRLLGTAEFGLWSWVSATINLVSVVEAGLSLSTTVFLARDLASDDHASFVETLTVGATSLLTLSVMAGVGVAIAAPLLLSWVPTGATLNSQAISSALQVSGIIVFCRMFQQLFVGAMQAGKLYSRIALLSLLQAGLLSGGLVVMAAFGGRVLELMLVTAGASIIMLGLHVYAFSSVPFIRVTRFSWNWTKAGDMLRYGVSTWLTSVGGAIFGQLDRIVVGSMLGASVLGIYSVMTSIATQINALSSVPIQPLIPYVSQLWSQGGGAAKRVAREFQRSLSVNAAISIGMAICLIAIAPELTNMILSRVNDLHVTTYFQLVVAIYAIYSLNAAGYFVLFATNNEKVNMVVVLCSGVLALLLIMLLGRRYGLLGAVLGNVGFAGTLALNWIASRRVGAHATLFRSEIVPISLLVGVLLATQIPFDWVGRLVVSAVALVLLLVWLIKSTDTSFNQVRAFAVSFIR